MVDYITTIAAKFPNCQVSCFGDPTIYSNLQLDAGDPLPSQEDLDVARLQLTKDNIWILVKEVREAKKNGGIQEGDFWFKTDGTARVQYFGLSTLESESFTDLQWKTMTGVFTDMTLALANTLSHDIILRDTVIATVAETHKTALTASSDPDSYDYTTGWPPVFGD